MGSVEGCRHTWHGLRRVRDLPIISVQRYPPVLGALMRLPGALAPHLVQVPLQTPRGSVPSNSPRTRGWQGALAPV
jgi:hypothetical protein